MKAATQTHTSVTTERTPHVTETYIDNIDKIAQADAEGVRQAEVQYGGSWKKRGGVGAFMMLARKWDRLEKAVEAKGWDIFQLLADDDRPEGCIDDIRDLRRYLLLVEAEGQARGLGSCCSSHRDNQTRYVSTPSNWLREHFLENESEMPQDWLGEVLQQFEVDSLIGVVKEVVKERIDQIVNKGFTPKHDDQHTKGELADAAAAYANTKGYVDTWPFEIEDIRPKDRRHDLIRAAALIVAEIERLDRASAAEATPGYTNQD